MLMQHCSSTAPRLTNNHPLTRSSHAVLPHTHTHNNQVLEKEPCNLKALLRRAAAREHLGGDSGRSGAAEDLEAVLRLEPGNKEALAHRRRLSGEAAAERMED